MEDTVDVHTAATLFKKLCYDNKNSVSAGIIVGGWDKTEGGSVYCIPLGGALVRQPFAIGGSGSTYIYGYCDAHYKEGMTREECHQFVRNGMYFTLPVLPLPREEDLIDFTSLGPCHVS